MTGSPFWMANPVRPSSIPMLTAVTDAGSRPWVTTMCRRFGLGVVAVDRAHLHIEAVGDQLDDALQRRAQIARFADQRADRLEEEQTTASPSPARIDPPGRILG
jgi:hypothetical protein